MRKVIDEVVLDAPNSASVLLTINQDLLPNTVTEKQKFKASVYDATLPDLFAEVLSRNYFPVEGGGSITIHDKEYKLTDKQFAKVKALMLSAVSESKDIGLAFADAYRTWVTGTSYRRNSANTLYTWFFNRALDAYKSVLDLHANEICIDPAQAIFDAANRLGD